MVDSLKFKDLKLEQLNKFQEVQSADECKTLETINFLKDLLCIVIQKKTESMIVMAMMGMGIAMMMVAFATSHPK